MAYQEARCDGIRFLSVNVTALNRDRLRAVLAYANGLEGLVFICLQETRHPAGGYRWASTEAARQGWSADWSHPPAKGRVVARVQGGTALLWPRELGKGRKAPTTDHRLVGRTWNKLSVFSTYGPAKGPMDLDWFNHTLACADAVSKHTCNFAVGDYNWKHGFESFTCDWDLAPTVNTTIQGTTAPSRALSKRATHVDTTVTPIEGIPHHCAVVWHYSGRDLPEIPPAAERLKRTANYEWREGDVTEADITRLGDWWRATRGPNLTEADVAPGGKCSTFSDCLDELKRWHKDAEDLLEKAGNEGIVKKITARERPKGSDMSTKKVASPSSRGPDENIRLRRARRILRAAIHWWSLDINGPLTQHETRHWAAAIKDKVVACDTIPLTRADAVDTANQAVEAAVAANAALCTRAWRMSFIGKAINVIKAAKNIIKPMSAPSISTAKEMRQEWAPVYKADGNSPQRAEFWKAKATKYEVPQAEPAQWEATREKWHEAIIATDGAAGPDGWTSNEFKGLERNTPEVASDLFIILIGITTYAAQAGSGQTNVGGLVSWRIVGIPKTGSEATRPIAVSSVIWRAWTKVLLPNLPPTPEGQWGGKEGSDLLTAIASWLLGPGNSGVEKDLTKCFDTVDLCVACAALRWQGTHPNVIDILNLGWHGPRTCHQGGLSDPIWPDRGIPQGDSCSPRVLAVLLTPWHFGVEVEASGVHAWAYMDDRSFRYDDPDELEKAEDFTAEFDTGCGLVENMAKRQAWTGNEEVEHLGLKSAPLTFKPALPRNGWDPLYDLIARLPSCPGSSGNREVIAKCYIRPVMQWAAPLVAAPPADTAFLLRKAILRTGCTWWCHGRFWADRPLLHPIFGTAVTAFKHYYRVKDYPSPVRSAALQEHARALRLYVTDADQAGVHLAPLATAGAGITDLCRLASEASGEPYNASAPFRFFATSETGGHFLRAIARKVALTEVKRQRLDSEGIDNVDVLATTGIEWRRWVSKLSPEDSSALGVWRGGAVFTATRRWFQRDPLEMRCTLCNNCHLGSARHLWADCTHLDEVRNAIAAKYSVPAGWWQEQPRCTSKTGWIVYEADASLARRKKLAIAANELGIAVAKTAKQAKANFLPTAAAVEPPTLVALDGHGDPLAGGQIRQRTFGSDTKTNITTAALRGGTEVNTRRRGDHYTHDRAKRNHTAEADRYATTTRVSNWKHNSTRPRLRRHTKHFANIEFRRRRSRGEKGNPRATRRSRE